MLQQTIPAFPPRSRGKSSPLKVDKTGKKLIYCSGRTVIIRDIEPSASGSLECMTYSGECTHTHQFLL